MYSNSTTEDITDSWHRELASALRDIDRLCDRLKLPDKIREQAHAAGDLFPLMVTESYLKRISPGDLSDPLLKQILPLAQELNSPAGFTNDAVDDLSARRAPGLLHKYPGRVLLIATGACAIHCRYCFRRSYPYGEEPRKLADWESTFDTIKQDRSIHEVILSGGDPLMLTDERLEAMISRLDSMDHLTRLRLHTRLPIVLPNRVTDRLLALFQTMRLMPIWVVHVNHPQELAEDVRNTLRRVQKTGIPLLNQSVLLQGVNNSADTLEQLSESLINLGVMPYYLHQLDRVNGTSHFEVDDDQALKILSELRNRLPGYAVPQLVREHPGELSKLPLIK